jgi:hypothetical protein
LRFLDPNLGASEDLELPKSSSTLSGSNLMVTGLILDGDPRILQLKRIFLNWFPIGEAICFSNRNLVTNHLSFSTFPIGIVVNGRKK